MRVDIPSRLIFWMHHVAAWVNKAGHSPAPRTIHKTRTSLRRCLSLTGMLRTAYARKIISSARPLFKSCAVLRDLQVMRDEIAQLPMDRNIRRNILARITAREKTARVQTKNALRDFSRARWKVLTRTAGTWKVSSQDLSRFRRFILKRLKKISKRYKTCSGPKVSSENLHRLRISIKKFRDTVENCFPNLYEKYGAPLKKLQDALGRHQDLIVLEKELALMGCLTQAFKKSLENERSSLRRKFLRMTAASNRTGMWERWRRDLERI